MPLRKIDSASPTTAQTRQAVIDNTRTNFQATVDSLIMGGPSFNAHANGWVMSQTIGTGSAEAPQYHTWTNQANTAEQIRAEYARSGNYVTSVTWSYTENSGGAWSTIRVSTVTYTSTNMTGGNNSSIFHWFFELLGKFLDLRTAYNAHAALTSGVHGIGTMAAQNLGAVNIDGGTIDGTTIGASVTAEARFTRAIETSTAASGSSGAQNLSWANGGSEWTSTSAITFTFTNLPPTGYVGTHLVRVAHFDTVTWPAAVDWGSGGKPTLGTNKAAEVMLITRNGGLNVYASVVWRQA